MLWRVSLPLRNYCIAMWNTRFCFKTIRRILYFGVLATIVYVSAHYAHLYLFAATIGDARVLRHEVTTVQTISSQVNDSQTKQMQERRRHVEDVCKSQNFSGVVYEVAGSKALNISVCLVQKAGCTQWSRIFKYLAGQKKESGNPSSISKYEVHFVQKHLLKRFHVGAADKDFIAHSLRTVTVRHPFTRLWSAYVDKFVLPDFWSFKGKQIIRMVRKNASRLALKCGHDVTFQEFVDYVLRIGHGRQFMDFDRHWMPASDLCDPCKFLPDIVQKQESLVKDFEFSMTKIGLEQLFKTMFSQPSTESEIEDEIDYVFKVFDKHTNCLTKAEIPRVIWKAFILNGYIPPNATLPTTIQPNVTKESMYAIVRNARIRSNMTSQRKRDFRAAARREAYSSLTVQQMAALKDLYKMDFLFFDYSDMD